MRAGGVGGVAWLQTGAVQSYSYGTGAAEVHVPLADHMGNVRHYYQFKASGSKVTGQLVASYEYDAFGREVRAWGLNTPATNQPPGLPASRPWADLLPFHYSSKLRDVDSGFNYYGYRFYDPGAGRWLNRDPIGERGGRNLYGMVGNDAVNRVDAFGLAEGSFELTEVEVEEYNEKHGPNGKKGFKVEYTKGDPCSCIDPDEIIFVQAISYDDWRAGYDPHFDYDKEQGREQTKLGGQPFPRYPGREGGAWMTDAPGHDDLSDDNTWYLEVCAVCRHKDASGKISDKILGCIRFNFGNKTRKLDSSGGGAKDPTEHFKDAQTHWDKLHKNSK